MNELILIAEDEPEIAKILDAYLVREGYRTVNAADGQTALDQHAILKPDLVLLDVKMPKIDGWDVLAELRRRGETPIIMITALDQDLDRLQGLRLGADDYVVKPFNPLEVVARAKAVLRRSGYANNRTLLRIENLEIDLESHLAKVHGDGTSMSLQLTLTEFRLLAHMAKAPTRAFGRNELIDACLPGGDALERTVDSHVSNLRRKLDEAGATGMMSVVRGIGYRLTAA
ncbi:response regulator [Rhodopseudomonas palustris]|uniref:response regulator n=1 Tax=Rhodopseudomonas palustris TaxID=1076 RepID=UPI0022F00CD9|nr:response regulator [Rhodopseudomonas palustris]WBU32155.1 response regulator [Rhodopseudomonas palustris]